MSFDLLYNVFRFILDFIKNYAKKAYISLTKLNLTDDKKSRIFKSNQFLHQSKRKYRNKILETAS